MTLKAAYIPSNKIAFLNKPVIIIKKKELFWSKVNVLIYKIKRQQSARNNSFQLNYPFS